MPFVLIKGRFVPAAGVPGGDSVRFLADNLDHWKKLEGKNVHPGAGVETKDTVQLRLEGIDAIAKGAIKPLSVQARDNLLKLLGHSATEPQPRGHVLARMTDDKSGRPICFAFAGSTSEPDGKDDVFLSASKLTESANYKQMLAGFAYPLYYNTLFASLRQQFTKGHSKARSSAAGYFQKKSGSTLDRTTKGVKVKSKDDLRSIPPIWPKLWRRLEEHLGKPGASLSTFVAFLEAQNERVDILSQMEERGLQDVVEVKGDVVRLKFAPEDIRVVAEAGQRNR